MKIIFMGTPDIAAECLTALIDGGYNVVAAVCQPDKPKGRGYKLCEPEVKAAAKAAGIPVYQPESLKNGELQEVLDEYKPDLIAVVAYGKILPEYILSYPEKGCINLHASLLPKYRGAAPIQWAVINGDKVSGLTTMKMDKGLDTGDMLLKTELEIGEYETSEELFERMAKAGGELLCKTIDAIDEITPVPQNESESSYAPMIKKEYAHIDWTKSAEKISKLICGMYSWPLAYSIYKGEPVKIIKATVADGKGECGRILAYEKGKGLIVAAGEGAVCLEIIQFAGKKRMSVDDYMRGNSIEIGEILG